MIVLIELFPPLTSIISRFLLFSTSESLEHPIIVIFTTVLLITGEARLDRPFELVLFDLY
jgi:hypothetical protein